MATMSGFIFARCRDSTGNDRKSRRFKPYDLSQNLSRLSTPFLPRKLVHNYLPMETVTVHSNSLKDPRKPVHLKDPRKPVHNEPHVHRKPVHNEAPVQAVNVDLISCKDKQMVDYVINHAWSHSTLDRYDASVKQFFSFCHSRGIAPTGVVSEDLLCSFAASMAGSRAGGTAAAKIAAVKAWHVQNNLPWMGSSRLKYTLKGTENLRPQESIKPKRPPVSSEMLDVIRNNLDMGSPEDACIWAIVTTSFWSQIRMGEICPKTEKDFNVALTPTWQQFGNPNRSGSRTLHLPRTKRGGTKGETVMVSRQRLKLDPIAALENHARVNRCQTTDTVAAFRNASGILMGLTLRRLLRRVTAILAKHKFPRITGHCFRIGGTTELLLQGVPPDIVKLLGRWTSDSFLRYWRSLEIIAPMYVELLKPIMSHLDRH